MGLHALKFVNEERVASGEWTYIDEWRFARLPAGYYTTGENAHSIAAAAANSHRTIAPGAEDAYGAIEEQLLHACGTRNAPNRYLVLRRPYFRSRAQVEFPEDTWVSRNPRL
jgi:hypothetical protein